MEDAFHLDGAYLGAYRARLNANLAFWDGLDGKVDWPTDGNGGHPLTANCLRITVGTPPENDALIAALLAP